MCEKIEFTAVREEPETMRHAFANCVLDADRHVLERNGEIVPVEPQVFDLLCLLAENPDKLITKDQMIDAVWQGRIVSEATISARINAARTAVGDSGKQQLVIKTIPRRGIKLVAPVKTQIAGSAHAQGQNSKIVRQTTRYANSPDGTKIAYAISGDGPVVMRAGHFLTHLEKDWQSPVWGPYLEVLSSRYTLVRYDQRGTGLSEPELGSTDIEAYVGDLLAVADAAGLKRFPLIASSQGVPVAISLAAQHPERVRCLVLYGGFAQGRSSRDHAHSSEEAEALLAMIRAGWGKPESAFMAAFTSVFCPGANREELQNLIDIQMESTSPENAARIRNAIDQFDVTDLLERVQAPTLVIHASRDSVHPVEQSRLIASSIPDAEFLQVDSKNHIYLPSDPAWQEIVTAQLEFVKKHL